MIAMALACGPDLLIADEPTTALDVTIQAQILDLIAGLVAESGMALLLITHDLGVVSEMAERVVVLYAGRVMETGRTGGRVPPPRASLHARPVHRLAARAAARMPAPGTRLAAIPGQVPDPRALPPGCPFAPRCPRVAPDCLPAPPPLLPLADAPGHLAACLHPCA